METLGLQPLIPDAFDPALIRQGSEKEDLVKSVGDSKPTPGAKEIRACMPLGALRGSDDVSLS